MNARKKLNRAFFTGSLLFASFAGGIAESWQVFLVTFGLCVASNFYLGEIRLSRRIR